MVEHPGAIIAVDAVGPPQRLGGGALTAPHLVHQAGATGPIDAAEAHHCRGQRQGLDNILRLTQATAGKATGFRWRALVHPFTIALAVDTGARHPDHPPWLNRAVREGLRQGPGAGHIGVPVGLFGERTRGEGNHYRILALERPAQQGAIATIAAEQAYPGYCPRRAPQGADFAPIGGHERRQAAGKIAKAYQQNFQSTCLLQLSLPIMSRSSRPRRIP